MKPSSFFYVIGFGMIAVTFSAYATVVLLNGWGSLPFLLVGSLAWLVSVGLKFAWAVPTNRYVIRFFKEKLLRRASGLVTWSYFGFLTGAFECGIALLFVLKLPLLSQAEWSEALAFGVGFGAVEVLLLGFFSFVKVFKMSEKDKQSVKSVLPLLVPLSVVDRTSVLFVHAFTKVLVVLAVQQSNYALFWLSFGFKSMLDGIASSAHLKWKVLESTARLWITELIVIIFGMLGMMGLWLLYTAYY